MHERRVIEPLRQRGDALRTVWDKTSTLTYADGASFARAEAAVVAIDVVLTAAGVFVVIAITKEAAAFVEVIPLVVEVRGTPARAMTAAVAGLTAHVIFGAIASETSGGERCMDSCGGCEAVDCGLVARLAFCGTDSVAVPITAVAVATVTAGTVAIALHNP